MRRRTRPGTRPSTQSMFGGKRSTPRFWSSDVYGSFELGMDVGESQGRKWGWRDALRELAPMTEDELVELRDEVRDDLMTLAEEAGVTPIGRYHGNGDALADEVEQYLRGLDDGAA